MPSADLTLGVWEYASDDEAGLRVATAVAQDRLTEPDLEVVIVSSRGDHLTVQLVRGELEEPADILYVQGHGTFELVRIEPWPGSRMLLVLRAWPRPEH